MIFMISLFSLVPANDSLSLQLGPRFQKTWGLYWENGIEAQFSHSKIANHQARLKLSWLSSSLGSAYNSNAIHHDYWQSSFAWHFLPEFILQPVTQFNLGYYRFDYEYEIFKNLPHTSALASLQFGVQSHQLLNFGDIWCSMGYNFITGDGVNGPGTLYPLFFSFGFVYNMGFSIDS
jgi:hypothetical protein